jgi:Nickel responsive protein SCO4226-like
VPMYLVERQFEVGEEDMPAVGRRSRSLIEVEFTEITWYHSHVTLDDRGLVKTYCIYAAPSEDAVRQHAEKLGMHQVMAVYEVVGDVTPSDFPPV